MAVGGGTDFAVPGRSGGRAAAPSNYEMIRHVRHAQRRRGPRTRHPSAQHEWRSWTSPLPSPNAH
eukprot:3569322-Prymnesium_polylepis.1